MALFPKHLNHFGLTLVHVQELGAIINIIHLEMKIGVNFNTFGMDKHLNVAMVSKEKFELLGSLEFVCCFQLFELFGCWNFGFLGLILSFFGRGLVRILFFKKVNQKPIDAGFL